MKVRDFIEQSIDVDVYDDVCEELAIAFCGPMRLTDQGAEKFADVLDYEIELNTTSSYTTATVVVDDGTEDGWEERLRKAEEFFQAAAGYCADSDYRCWFEAV